VPDGDRRLHDGRLQLTPSRGGPAALAGPPLRAASFVAALALGGCSGAPTVRYTATVSDSVPRTAQVDAAVTGFSGDSLVMRGFAPARALRITELRAFDAAGRSLHVRDAPDSSADPSPQFVVRGPLRGPVHVTWRVDPNVRVGDAHVGYTGVRAGYLGDAFGLVTGRGLFLVPLPAPVAGDVRVTFHLPRGWHAVTPWQDAGSGWRTDLGGQFAAEHLVAATVGLGAFRERTFRVGATEYVVDVAASVPDSVATATLPVLEATARRARALYGRDLGPRYRIVACAAAPDGDEIHGERWATGQGGTLLPLTPLRLHDFARNLADAHLRYEPYRVEVAGPEEFWLVDGLAEWFGWRAVAAAGLGDASQIAQRLAVSYVRSRQVQGAEHDLERIYATTLATEETRATDAPLVLEVIDRLVRQNSRDSLESVVRSMFQHSPAASLWSSLPGGAATWSGFRERHVRGHEPIDVARLFGMTSTRPRPDPPGGEPTHGIELVVTGDTYGFLEHCGCKANQSGGVARRATMIARLRHADPEAVLLDAGNAFLRDEKMGAQDYLSREEQKLYLRTMAREGYAAVGIGTTELTYGVDWFEEARRGVGLPYASANLAWQRAPLAPPVRFTRAHGLRIAVIPVFERPAGPGVSRRFEDHAASVTIDDPVAALARTADSVRVRTDLLVAMGRLSPATIRRAIAACPALDVVISTDWDAPVRSDSSGAGTALRDHPGFVGHTLVLYTDSENYGLEIVTIGIDRDDHVTTARTVHHTLFEDVPDDPGVRAMLDRFYPDIGARDSAQESVTPLFADVSARMTGEYVGAARCASCHAEEAAQWRTTAHAGAYKTLLDAHRHYQPRCVVCHVVGFRTARGFQLGNHDEHLAGVQCEVCHGPGGDHVRHPSAVTIAREVPESVCLQCHTPDHSDHFVYTAKLPLVAHRKTGV